MDQELRAQGAATVVYDEGLRRYFSNVFATMALGLGITAIVSYMVSSSPILLSWMTTVVDGKIQVTWIWIAIALIELAMVWKMANWIDDRSVTMVGGLTMFAIYAAMNGLTMAPIIHAYTSASVTKAFAVSAVTFGGCALWGYTTKADVRPLGSFLLVGLIGMIVALVVNVFLQSPAVDFAVSVIGVLIFAGLTAWDVQMLRTFYHEYGSSPGLVVNGALAFYLDFVNLFQLFLRFFGVKTGD